MSIAQDTYAYNEYIAFYKYIVNYHANKVFKLIVLAYIEDLCSAK